jgi:hypothetical protein
MSTDCLHTPHTPAGTRKHGPTKLRPVRCPTHVTIKPPVDDKRKRAVERFGFTRVFEEDAGQLDLFSGTGAVSMIEGVLGARGREGRDGLLATLGVTGSGKVCLDEEGTGMGDL